jgi:hypothetical protein
MRSFRVGIPMLAAAALLSAPARGDVSASPDVALALSGTTVRDGEIAYDDPAGGVFVALRDALPDGVDVDGYHADGPGALLFSTDVAVALPGGVVAAPEDVVLLSGGIWTIVFDGSAEGVPPDADVDALTRLGADAFLLSFDTTVDLGGVVADDEDVVAFDGVGFGLALDVSALAVSPAFDPALDVDALDARPDGGFALSFDGSGSAGGVAFDDEDVLLVDPLAPSVTMSFDASSTHASWSVADLDAVMVPEPAIWMGLLAGGLLLVALPRSRGRS